VLGLGPWATVVRTRSRDLGHEIALKVFVDVDPELLERVRHEVRAVLALATPYLVRTYTLFNRGMIAWFEMERSTAPTCSGSWTGYRWPVSAFRWPADTRSPWR
jgi:hypothetical protein